MLYNNVYVHSGQLGMLCYFHGQAGSVVTVTILLSQFHRWKAIRQALITDYTGFCSIHLTLKMEGLLVSVHIHGMGARKFFLTSLQHGSR